MSLTGEPIDAAWVAIDTPLTPGSLAAFCQDMERLYRINPYLEFHAWKQEGEDRARLTFKNLSNKREYDLKIRIRRESNFDFLIRYDQGTKKSTRLQIEAHASGSRLRITDDYALPENSPTPDPEDADKSLHAWGVALHDYLRHEFKWGKHAFWRWYMRRVWIPMRPGARRITYMLLMITLAEIALIALVMTIYWIENQR